MSYCVCPFLVKPYTKSKANRQKDLLAAHTHIEMRRSNGVRVRKMRPEHATAVSIILAFVSKSHSSVEIYRLFAMLSMWELQKLLCLEVRLRDRDRVEQENDTGEKKMVMVTVMLVVVMVVHRKSMQNAMNLVIAFHTHAIDHPFVEQTAWQRKHKANVYCQITLQLDFKPFHCRHRYWQNKCIYPWQIQFSRKSNHRQHTPHVLCNLHPMSAISSSSKALETHAQKKKKDNY